VVPSERWSASGVPGGPRLAGGGGAGYDHGPGPNEAPGAGGGDAVTDRLSEDALDYHRAAPAGKLAVTPTKPLATQRDLSLAYSPGVAAACLEIERDPVQAAYLTARSNLVAVVSNGTAVLGLGAIGALASKPVMEGKAVLFKKFAGIDAFDIEIEERDPAKLVEVVAALEATFGAINLEDIKAPECFEVERRLRERMRIPVFHDDQHGTAIIVAAAVRNGLELGRQAAGGGEAGGERGGGRRRWPASTCW
jgi:malate dehydrogenase (oxaloacetate-decarboxylating)(NADP+)